jgi:predicted ATPase
MRQPELEFIFRNELIRDASYQSILRRQRRKYHLRVGDAFEELFPEKTDKEVHRLAYHFNLAHDHARAFKYFKIAGDQSIKLFAN